MLTGIPRAKKYFLSPLKTLIATGTHEKLILIGGEAMMNQAALWVDDSQVAMLLGVRDEQCTLFVDLTDVECVDILNKAKQAFDARAIGILNAKENSQEVK